MCKVKEILRKKGDEIHAVEPDASILDAVHLMAKEDIGMVLVVENAKIVGIFSERDCVYNLASEKGFSLQTPVRQVMTSPVYYVTPDQTMEDCMAVMTAKCIRHLPVLDREELVGVISIGDVVKNIVLEKDSSIKDLEKFLWVNLI
jgi:CBS domain-containing protein